MLAGSYIDGAKASAGSTGVGPRSSECSCMASGLNIIMYFIIHFTSKNVILA